MSVVDMILARHGFEWKLYPYRIVDAKSQKVVFHGPHFDLRDSVLRARRKAFDRQTRAYFSKKVS